MADKGTHVSETQDSPSMYQQSERFDFHRSPPTKGDPVDNAKYDVENSFEQGARDKSWATDPTNFRNK